MLHGGSGAVIPSVYEDQPAVAKLFIAERASDPVQALAELNNELEIYSSNPSTMSWRYTALILQLCQRLHWITGPLCNEQLRHSWLTFIDTRDYGAAATIKHNAACRQRRIASVAGILAGAEAVAGM